MARIYHDFSKAISSQRKDLLEKQSMRAETSQHPTLNRQNKEKEKAAQITQQSQSSRSQISVKSIPEFSQLSRDAQQTPQRQSRAPKLVNHEMTR